MTLDGVKVSTLTVSAAEASIASVGDNALAQVHLRAGVSLAIGGTGVLRHGFPLELVTCAACAARETGPSSTTGTVKMPGVPPSFPASVTAPPVRRRVLSPSA